MKTVLLPRGSLYQGDLVLVNAAHPCHTETASPALQPVPQGTSGVPMARTAAGALERLMAALDGWREITAVSGWRSMQEQQAIWTQSLRDSGEAFTRRFVALPGRSEHQTGLAVDLARRAAVIDFICPDFPDEGLCGAFRRRAAAFGFVQRYPQGKEGVTGIGCEPWHFRYVGVPHAEEMQRHGLVLEEYIDFLRGFGAACPLRGQSPEGVPYAIFFLPVNGAKKAGLDVGEAAQYAVSGNNVDGWVVTAWGQA